MNPNDINPNKDYYSVIGVNENSSGEEIKKAYRKLSLELHPDRKGGDTEKFKELNEAYSVLGDNDKKKQYDMMRKGGGMRHEQTMHVNPDEIFNMFFGGGGGGIPGMHPGMAGMFPPGMFGATNFQVFKNGVPFNMGQALQKPTPIIMNIEISLDDALVGASKPIEIERWIHETQTNTKRIEKETLYINIPKGIDDNEMIILQEKGNMIGDNNKGDIKLFVKINNTSQLTRDGLNLIYKKQITLKESLCGFSFDLPYLNGKTFKISNSGGVVVGNGYNKVIPNLGLSRDDHVGSLVINFTILYPEKISEEQVRELERIL
jgi:DnaJ-class molecular chaperone